MNDEILEKLIGKFLETEALSEETKAFFLGFTITLYFSLRFIKS